MKRVIVIGCPGSGKSTFARKLAAKTNLPLYYLDMYWHKADKTTYTESEFDEKLQQILITDNWILDGNYQRTLSERLKRSDTVFLLDYPVEVCLEGVRERIGQKRIDLPWQETEFDPEFKDYIINFSRDRLPEIYQSLEKYKPKVNVNIFKSRAEANNYLMNFSNDNS